MRSPEAPPRDEKVAPSRRSSADLDHDADADDLETGPFLGSDAAAAAPVAASASRKLACASYRGRLIAVACALVCVLLSLGFFVAIWGSPCRRPHNPEAAIDGSAEVVTLQQVLSGFWRPESHEISWIASPTGEDGLLLEQAAKGKGYLVVEDVRAGKGTADGHGNSAASLMGPHAPPRTLMKEGVFDFAGRQLQPDWLEPSPDLTKVLLGVGRKQNWRHSFTATYFIFDVASQTAEPLVPFDADAEVQLAAWSPRSDAVSFTRGNNLFMRRLGDRHGEGDGVVQITADGGPDLFYGVPDWVYEEEVLSGRSATWWSTDGQFIAFLRTNETLVSEYPVQYFIDRPDGEPADKSEALYPDVRQIKYPKAGSANPVVDLQFYDVAASHLFAVPVSGQLTDDDRIINSLLWAGDRVVVKQTNRISDVLQVLHIDVRARRGSIVRAVNVGDVDGGWFEITHDMTFVRADPARSRAHDGYIDTVVHQGYDHLAYFSPVDSHEPAVMLTSGPWEVVDGPAAVDLANNLVYFVAAKEASTQRHVYSVHLDGSGLRPLTDTATEAYYTASFSSRAGFALLSYQGPGVPTQKIVSTPSAGLGFEAVIEANQLLADRARTHRLPALKHGILELESGVSVNYLERRPPGFDPDTQYPVLFHQYSGPGSQSVDTKFTVDFQSYVAAALGYLVVTVDPRGTGFRGRAFRVPVRSRLGVLEAEDHIAAARRFASLPYVDPSRLAIWGWSYGGFQTLKTLERDAGATFSYGIAVAPVTDWRFYDSIYAERYMRSPHVNEVGYDASRISNASALARSKRFLLMHGVADDNVHFQNSLALLDELDLAGVINYDVHVFPDSDHAIRFHGANIIVYEKLRNWLVNAFNGEWLKVADPRPNGKGSSVLLS